MNAMLTPKSIVIVRLSALGDVLMCIPLVRTLQAAFPGVKLTWVISRPAFDLVEGMDGVEFIVIDKPKNLFDYYRFYQQMRHRKFDVLLAMQASFRANLLYPLIRAKRKIGYDQSRANDGHGWFVQETIQTAREHTLEGFLRFGAAIGAVSPVIRWGLPIAQVDREWVKEHLPSGKKFLVINPAASKSERSWPVNRYIQIARMAQGRWGVQVVLTGGPGEYDRRLADEIGQAVPDCIDLVGKTKPKQLLAVIEAAHMVLCPDTGPSHMAASMGTPVVALHAVTSSLVSGPYTFMDLVVDYYPQALQDVLNQHIDSHQWTTHVHGEDIMAYVPVDEVVARLDVANKIKQS
jgi:heptosyltransferase I